MASHSALLFLEVARQANIVSFDLGDCPWTRPQGDLLKASYGSRFELVLGLSANIRQTRYAMRHLESTGRKLECDVAFVDGSKFHEQRWTDMLNFRNASRAGTLLIYDEATSVACVNGSTPRSTPRA